MRLIYKVPESNVTESYIVRPQFDHSFFFFFFFFFFVHK